MSANPQAMAQMLASGLSQPSGDGSPMGAGAQLAQKIMLMRALQQGQPPQQNPLTPPQPNILGQVAAQPQAMQQMQMPGGVNA